MRQRWIILSLLLTSMAPGSAIGAKPAGKPEKKLTPREDAATEKAIFKLLAGLLQIGAGASEANLDLIERGSRDLAHQRAAARREGIPLTPQEFQRPLPPPSLNAAPIYEQLTRLLKAKPLDEKLEESAERLGSRYRYGPDDVAAARKLLAERQDVMMLVHQATDRPQCVFQRDWSLGSDVILMFPELASARTAARLLKIDSYVLALDGHYPEAIADQARGFRVAAHFAPHGTITAYLEAAACEALALEGMQGILCLAGSNATVAEQVRTAVEANRPTYSLRRVLRGETVLAMDMMNECRRAGPRSLFLFYGDMSQAEAEKQVTPMKQEPAGRRLWKLLLDAGEADILSKMQRAIAIAQRPYRERRHLWQQWDHSITDRSTGFVGIFAGAGLSQLLTLGNERAMTVRAEEEEVMTGAEALAYRAKHGEWPDRLEQIDSYPPMDPFTGRSLKYHRTPDGFVLYSLGENGRDDGGQAPTPGTPARDWKAVFRYPAPPPQPYPPAEIQPSSPNSTPSAKS